MGTALLLAVIALGQIPTLGRSHGSMGIQPSWISGRVQAKSGHLVPIATVSVRPNATADSRDPGWSGAVLRTKPDGFFRLQVPGEASYEVCATVPGGPKQCQTVTVEASDLEIATFVF